MRIAVGVMIGVAAALAAPAAAGGAQVDAEGNLFTGGLGFDPAAVTVAVGETVTWRNTDPVVPHTATEDHRLWDLGGDHGQTPANEPGFGPGEEVERRFEAGLHHYYCRVHPDDMRGTVAVPPVLARKRVRVIRRVRVRRRGTSRRRFVRRQITRRYVVVTWAATRPVAGLVFDLQRRRPADPPGAWRPLRIGTTSTRRRFRVRRGAVWDVRARLRRIGSPTAATDWAVARITG